jgi:acetylornithine/succinyldiaminopimelate/putrescine aminotransferase
MESPGKCLFCNSGAEANEALLKLARKFGHLTPKADGSPRRGRAAARSARRGGWRR